MSDFLATQPTMNVSICSSVNDGWRNIRGASAFESWHFDAVSDDGREALIITFYANYPLSPRFFQQHHRETTGNGESMRFPAVSFVYFCDGEPVLSAVNELRSDEFVPDASGVGYTMGNSSFRMAKEDYGTGYVVTIDIHTFRGRRIHAEVEWVFVESDLMHPDPEPCPAVWNIVGPRSDVSGRISLIGRRGKTRKLIHFRGSGYHDHFVSESEHSRDFYSRMWGRGHFVDSTAVFICHGASDRAPLGGRIFLIRDRSICEMKAQCEVVGGRLNRWGQSVPQRISFISDDGIRLTIEPIATIRGGFADLKMLTEIVLELSDGKIRKTTGIVEFVNPERMKTRLFRWVSDFRIGRDGRSPYF